TIRASGHHAPREQAGQMTAPDRSHQQLNLPLAAQGPATDDSTRERAMQRFRQMRSLQKFASVHASIHNHFNSERHLVDRQTYKIRRSAAYAEWQNLTA
ncbi:MAG: hypothetical protein AB7G24_14770, partial [Novosphingobium sp.]